AGEDAAIDHSTDLISAQAISRLEQDKIRTDELDANSLVAEKRESYENIASDIESTYPSAYPLFSGEDQGSRLGVATLALFASVFAGGLILAGSVALIVLKIAFLLLFIFAPVFLLIGIHPGYGRAVLLRWVEMMVGFLLKQLFLVLLIALLVMCYGIVMSTNLGWGLQMILLALFTLTLFIYRKPFVHLFSSVNANTFTSRVVSDVAQSQALGYGANVLPPVVYLKAQNWGRRKAWYTARGAAGIPAAPGGGTDTAAVSEDTPEAASEPTRVRGRGGYGRVRDNESAPPLNVNRSTGADR